MNAIINKRKHSLLNRFVSAFVAFTFIFSLVLPPQVARAQAVSATMLNLPMPGTMVTTTSVYDPALIKGMTLHPENALEFNFLVDAGDTGMNKDELAEQGRTLVKYFLASLTVPEDEMWVNLSPYEGDRIISTEFGKTEMGRDLLAQDYILKQLTSSMIYPEDELGKKFWERVYSKAQELYGTTDIPINTFNKVWIVPDKALVFQKENSVYILNSHLKVMLEEDYLALEKNKGNKAFKLDALASDDADIISGVSSDVVREVLIPEIEKEVNEGENFANLRQIFNSAILAAWFKKNLKDSLLGNVYVDKNKVKGVDQKDVQTNQKIYEQYLEAFKKGAFNVIRDDYDEATKDVIPRRYFSGGLVFKIEDLESVTDQNIALLPQRRRAEIVTSYDRLREQIEGVDLDINLLDVGPLAQDKAVNTVLSGQGTPKAVLIKNKDEAMAVDKNGHLEDFEMTVNRTWVPSLTSSPGLGSDEVDLINGMTEDVFNEYISNFVGSKGTWEFKGEDKVVGKKWVVDSVKDNAMAVELKPSFIDPTKKIEIKSNGRLTTEYYLDEIKAMHKKYSDEGKKLKNLRTTNLKYELTKQEEAEYLEAIKKVLKEKGAKTVTPAILFEAAESALKGKQSSVKARVGLQPGTMNPITYGHISQSLSGILHGELNGVLIANGGTVPDKPYSSSAHLRNAMAKAAVDNTVLKDYLLVTGSRQQTVDMFEENDALNLAGKDEKELRFNMDMAAFIWLFVANPNVDWLYLVGGDKVAGYGKKDEKNLIIETLGKRPNVKVVYNDRTGDNAINRDTDIDPYPWMKERYDGGFFIRSTVQSYSDISATKIRTALSEGKDRDSDGQLVTDAMPVEIKDFITNSKELLTLYKVDILVAKAEKVIHDKETKEKFEKEFRKAVDVDNDYKKAAEIYNEVLDARKYRSAIAKYEEAQRILNDFYNKYKQPISTERDLFKKIQAQIRERIKVLNAMVGLIEGKLKSNDVARLSVDNMADLLRLLPLGFFGLEEKFLLYSAAPGSGKGELMNRSFSKKAKYGDLIAKLLLYHSRKAREGEIDGVKYHFGNENVGNQELNRLLRLANKGDIETVFVNKQLQGVAEISFTEDVLIRKGVASEMLLPGDIIINENGKEVTPRPAEVKEPTPVSVDTVVEREIVGLNEVIKRKKVTILEGGFAWYKKLSQKSLKKAFTIFISPFEKSEIALRGRNQYFIDEMYSKPFDQFIAYSQMNLMRKKEGREDLNLKLPNVNQYLISGVNAWRKKFNEAEDQLDKGNYELMKEVLVDIGREEASIEGLKAYDTEQKKLEYIRDLYDALRANAYLISKGTFINELTHLIDKYFHESENLKLNFEMTNDDEKMIQSIYTAKALAYEAQMKLARDVDRGDTSEWISPPSHEDEAKADFTKREDMFNRVIEGVAQIMLGYNYERGGRGAVIVNRFIFDKTKVLERLDEVSEKFCAAYFEYLILAFQEAKVLNDDMMNDRKSPDKSMLGKINKKDNALTSVKAIDTAEDLSPGGIDLDPKLLDLQIKRDPNGVPLPVMQQPIGEMNIQGFIPIIINITPITELPMLIGYDDKEDKTDDSNDLSFGPMDRKAKLELANVN